MGRIGPILGGQDRILGMTLEENLIALMHYCPLGEVDLLGCSREASHFYGRSEVGECGLGPRIAVDTASFQTVEAAARGSLDHWNQFGIPAEEPTMSPLSFVLP